MRPLGKGGGGEEGAGARSQELLRYLRCACAGSTVVLIVYRCEIWHRVNERHWIHEGASGTTGWVYSLLHGRYRVYV